MPKTAGSFWVDANTLHYIDSTGNEWYFTGTLTGVTVPGTALAGSVWIDGTTLHYLDSTKKDRSIPSSLVASRAGSANGSMWIQNTANTNYQLSIIAANNQRSVHDDVAASHVDTHSDVAGSNTHTDVAASHADQTIPNYTDTGGGKIHTDTHADTHSDSNSHTDVHTDHDDAHDDVPLASHGDYHEDIHDDVSSHTDSHTDQSHDDATVTHTDIHSDVAHTDAHTDTTVVHSDQPTSLGA